MNEPASTRLSGESPPVVARSSVTDDRSRVLKHGDAFALFDHCGDIKSGGLDEEGLYHQGTRFLSEFVLHVDGDRPFFLSSTLRREDGHLSVSLTNHDVARESRVVMPLGTLQISQTKFLWNSTLYQRLRVKNYGQQRYSTDITFVFAADFKDIFEVRGMRRKARGVDLEPAVTEEQVLLKYRGLDQVPRRTRLVFDPTPTRLTATFATTRVVLEPGEEAQLFCMVACEPGANDDPRTLSDFETARQAVLAQASSQVVRKDTIDTSNSQVDSWIDRATADLQLMTTQLETGPYPYAGVPWFNTPFGRDGIVTALECLWFAPGLARGVLSFLASTQAREVVPEEDAEPGKILHEIRNGEMAALREMPFGRYYGSADATPLFVVLLYEYYQRTDDRELVELLWPSAEAALKWIDDYGDTDRDGFVEYQRQCPTGLVHQGWKDSDDAIFHADGTLAEGPIALCEVQSFTYAAQRAGAKLAELLGYESRAQQLRVKARALREKFEEAFWCEEIGTYAFALDGQKRQCQVRSSNVGQCLFSGIVSQERAEQVAEMLTSDDFFSGWGIRTLGRREARYNPMGYHTGSVWPHDNALIALGFARYGLNDKVLPILCGLFEAGTYFDLNRMPELFCGFRRQASEGPVLYPVACAPQAWAAGSIFLLLQASLGLEIDAPRRVLRFNQPKLPAMLDWIELRNLQVQDAVVDVVLQRHTSDVGVNVLRRDGQLRTIVEK